MKALLFSILAVLSVSVSASAKGDVVGQCHLNIVNAAGKVHSASHKFALYDAIKTQFLEGGPADAGAAWISTYLVTFTEYKTETHYVVDVLTRNRENGDKSLCNIIEAVEMPKDHWMAGTLNK